MPVSKTELIEQRIKDSEASFQQAKSAIGAYLPGVEARTKAALDTAQKKILNCTVELCSAAATEEDSSLKNAVETANRKQAILDSLDDAEKILKDKMEQAREQIARFRKLLNRQKYVERCKGLIAGCSPVTDQQRQSLAGLAIDSVSAAEAHRLCEELNAHIERNQRLKTNDPFEYSVRFHGADDEITALFQ